MQPGRAAFQASGADNQNAGMNDLFMMFYVEFHCTMAVEICETCRRAASEVSPSCQWTVAGLPVECRRAASVCTPAKTSVAGIDVGKNIVDGLVCRRVGVSTSRPHTLKHRAPSII